MAQPGSFLKRTCLDAIYHLISPVEHIYIFLWACVMPTVNVLNLCIESHIWDCISCLSWNLLSSFVRETCPIRHPKIRRCYLPLLEKYVFLHCWYISSFLEVVVHSIPRLVLSGNNNHVIPPQFTTWYPEYPQWTQNVFITKSSLPI